MPQRTPDPEATWWVEGAQPGDTLHITSIRNQRQDYFDRRFPNGINYVKLSDNRWVCEDLIRGKDYCDDGTIIVWMTNGSNPHELWAAGTTGLAERLDNYAADNRSS